MTASVWSTIGRTRVAAHGCADADQAVVWARPVLPAVATVSLRVSFCFGEQECGGHMLPAGLGYPVFWTDLSWQGDTQLCPQRCLFVRVWYVSDLLFSRSVWLWRCRWFYCQRDVNRHRGTDSARAKQRTESHPEFRHNSEYVPWSGTPQAVWVCPGGAVSTEKSVFGAATRGRSQQRSAPGDSFRLHTLRVDDHA